MDEKRRILMIGNRESGKTTYMASAYGIMKSGKYGFCVSGDEGSDEWLMHIYKEIKKGKYPFPTDKRSEFSFDLFYCQKNVLSFEWIDYFGGVITESAVEQFSKDIEDADAIMLFLDANALKNGDTQITQFRRIQTLITEKLSQTDSLIEIVVVLTKYDLIEKDVSFEDVCRPLDNFKACLEERKNINFIIVPVSCTKNGFVNVDFPLIYILYTGLLIKYFTHYELFKIHNQIATELHKKIGIMDWIYSKIFGKKTNSEMYEEERKVLEKEAELVEALYEPTNQIGDYLKNYPLVIPSSEIRTAKSDTHRRSRFGIMLRNKKQRKFLKEGKNNG